MPKFHAKSNRSPCFLSDLNSSGQFPKYTAQEASKGKLRVIQKTKQSYAVLECPGQEIYGDKRLHSGRGDRMGVTAPGPGMTRPKIRLGESHTTNSVSALRPLSCRLQRVKSVALRSQCGCFSKPCTKQGARGMPTPGSHPVSPLNAPSHPCMAWLSLDNISSPPKNLRAQMRHSTHPAHPGSHTAGFQCRQHHTLTAAGARVRSMLG